MYGQVIFNRLITEQAMSFRKNQLWIGFPLDAMHGLAGT